MTFGALVAEEALTWVDTPFVWGQSVKGVGCDCKGLVAGVAKELGRPEAETLYAIYANYRADRPVPTEFLLEGMNHIFDRVNHIEVGDVLLCKFHGIPSHMAIFIGDNRVVHAYPSQHSKVQERDMGVLLYKYPLHSVWRWKGARDAS